MEADTFNRLLKILAPLIKKRDTVLYWLLCWMGLQSLWSPLVHSFANTPNLHLVLLCVPSFGMAFDMSVWVANFVISHMTLELLFPVSVLSLLQGRPGPSVFSSHISYISRQMLDMLLVCLDVSASFARLL